MKKNHTPKARTPRRTSTSTPEPIDHRALALLAYIDDGGPAATDAIAQARAILQGVAAEIASGDPEADPDVMHGSSGGPGIFGTIFDHHLKDYQRRAKGADPDLKPHAQFMLELSDDKVDDLTVTDQQVAFDVLVACVTDAAVLGAALMYELLNGGRVR